MNPLNPWVALTEMMILLGLAFFSGRTIAWFRYRKRIKTQEDLIQQVQRELNRFNQADPD